MGFVLARASQSRSHQPRSRAFTAKKIPRGSGTPKAVFFFGVQVQPVVYPLVNIQKTDGKITMLSMGKSTINHHFNSFLYVYQRVLLLGPPASSAPTNSSSETWRWENVVPSSGGQAGTAQNMVTPFAKWMVYFMGNPKRTWKIFRGTTHFN